MVKVSAVDTDLMGVSARALVEAVVAGERDPVALAGLARGRMRVKQDALVEALTGRFDAHHAELARMILDGYVADDAQVRRLGERIEALVAAQGVDPDGTTGPDAGRGADASVLPVLARLDRIPGVGAKTAQVIVAEVGLDMTRFPTPGHLALWARLSPRTVQSGPRSRVGGPPGQPLPQRRPRRSGRGRGKTNTFIGAPLPPPGQAARQAEGPGRSRALHLGLAWHLLADPASR